MLSKGWEAEKYANAIGKYIEIKICDDWQIFIQRIIYDNIKYNNIKGVITIARKLRVWFPGATYHIMHRGVRRKPIFEDEMDYQVFLQILKSALIKYRCVLHAYCLMTNHIHLLLETCDMEIGKFKFPTLRSDPNVVNLSPECWKFNDSGLIFWIFLYKYLDISS